MGILDDHNQMAGVFTERRPAPANHRREGRIWGTVSIVAALAWFVGVGSLIAHAGRGALVAGVPPRQGTADRGRRRGRLGCYRTGRSRGDPGVETGACALDAVSPVYAEVQMVASGGRRPAATNTTRAAAWDGSAGARRLRAARR